MVGPVPIGDATPTWYQVNTGLTIGPEGLHFQASLFVVQAVEFLPGTVIPTVPAILCIPSTAVPPDHCKHAGLFWI